MTAFPAMIRTKVSKYFTLDEIECQCGCGYSNMSDDTLAIADAVRDWQGSPVYCNSGCRCPNHNKAVGSKAMASRHLPIIHLGGGKFESDAMDLKVENPLKAAMYVKDNFPKASVIHYTWGIHIDCRDNPVVAIYPYFP